MLLYCSSTQTKILSKCCPQTGAGVARAYPVMVYIHGGDFSHGASNLFPGHMMAAFYEVVVVTINYRLGALGKRSSLNLLPYFSAHLFKAQVSLTINVGRVVYLTKKEM